jgi:tRNA(adenine34) deaminase
MVLARVERLVFGAEDPKAGFAGSLGDLVRDPRLNHTLEVTSGILGEEAGALLREFFKNRR